MNECFCLGSDDKTIDEQPKQKMFSVSAVERTRLKNEDYGDDTNLQVSPSVRFSVIISFEICQRRHERMRTIHPGQIDSVKCITKWIQ